MPTPPFARCRILIWVVWSLAAALISPVTACDRAGVPKQPELVVFAAASSADVIQQASHRFTAHTGVAIHVSTGPSGILFQQITSGARCDVFVPADPKYLTLLPRQLTRDRPIRELAANELVWACPKHSNRQLSLEQRLNSASRIAIANPDHAPAGQYARAALLQTGQWQVLEPKLVFANDARMTAHYVADGLVDLAIIYRSDAAAFSERITVLAPVTLPPNMSIRYQGIALGQGEQQLAEAFLSFLASTEVADIWRVAGFSTPLAGHLIPG